MMDLETDTVISTCLAFLCAGLVSVPLILLSLVVALLESLL